MHSIKFACICAFRTDSNGGHYNHSTGIYHYHNDGTPQGNQFTPNTYAKDNKYTSNDTSPIISEKETSLGTKILNTIGNILTFVFSMFMILYAISLILYLPCKIVLYLIDNYIEKKDRKNRVYNTSPTIETHFVSLKPEYMKPIIYTPPPKPDNIKFISITENIYKNKMVTLKVQGLPNRTHYIFVYYKSQSKAGGLESKISDGEGFVSWTWKVDGKITPGKYRIEISDSCCWRNNSDLLKINFEVLDVPILPENQISLLEVLNK